MIYTYFDIRNSVIWERSSNSTKTMIVLESANT